MTDGFSFFVGIITTLAAIFIFGFGLMVGVKTTGHEAAQCISLHGEWVVVAGFYECKAKQP